MAKKKTPEKSELELNMTSMLDIVFQLIIFFILVTNFAAAELPKLEPPTPENFNREKVEDPTVRLVNIVPVPVNNSTPEDQVGMASHVLFQGKAYKPVEQDGDAMKALTAKLDEIRLAMKDQGMDMKVDLRADRTLRFDQVQPVMMAVTAAGIARVNLVARQDKN